MRAAQDDLRQAVENTRVAGRPIEVILGVATVQGHDADGERLLSDADAAMFRNRQ